jgi:hypothetical protein
LRNLGLLIFALLGGILVGWIIFKRKYRSDSYFSYPVKPVDATDLEKPSIEIAPGIEIFQYERFPEKIKLGQSIDLPKETYRTFEPIFHAIPTGALAYDSATKWILKFSPEVTQGLNKGIYHLQSSVDGVQAVARDAQGRIVEHGRLFQAGMSPVAGVAIAWQILAIITAQKFLSDINKRLANIESAINEIKGMIDLQEWSKIEGAYKYLAENLNKLKNIYYLSQEEFNALLFHIEGIIKESGGKLSYFKGRANTIKNEILNLDHMNFDFLSQKIAEYIKYRSSCFAVYQAKMQAYYLKACLPVVNKEGCLYDIEKFKDELTKDIQEFNSEVEEIKKKIGTLYLPPLLVLLEVILSLFGLDTLQEKLKSELYKQNKMVHEKLEYIHQESQGIENNIKNQIEESKKPQYLEIEVKNNNITRVAILK